MASIVRRWTASAIATSSRVQLQHIISNGHTSSALTRNGGGIRQLHETAPLDPTGGPPTTPLAATTTFSDDTANRVVTPPAVSAEHVHVKLSYLHPATKALPLDHSLTDLNVLPSFLDASASRHRPPRAYVPLSSHVFGIEPRRDVLHAAVVYYLDGLRSGTASTKSRGQVAGSRRKIRPQKGSGKARLGRRNNPLLRGGGVIFGPKPRDFATKLPRRVRELALRSALSARWQAGDLHVVPSLHWDQPPVTTGILRRTLQTKQWDDALFLTAPRDPDVAPREFRRTLSRPSSVDPTYSPEQVRAHTRACRNFALSMSNIPRVELIELHTLTQEAQLSAKNPQQRKKPGELHAYEVLHRKKIILDLGAAEWLEQKLGGAIFHSDPEAQMTEEEHDEDEGAWEDEVEAEALTEEELAENEAEADEIVDAALSSQQQQQPKAPL